MRFPHLLAWIVLPPIVAGGAGSCGSEAHSTIPSGTGIHLAEIANGLSFPLYLTAPPGDLGRLFIVEKTGGIRIVKNGTLLPTAFLDLSGQVSGGSEQGLLGLAFYPDYATSGRFLVHYTDLSGNTRLSVFQVSSDPDVADGTSEQVILTADQPFPNHNGGQIGFGPDGFLYLGLGDGGSANDPQGRGQDRSDLLGSILRLDVSPGTAYTVPSDNPFVGQQPAVRPELWSYGLRNPWRFSFDRASGDLYIADVGQDNLEEIDVATASSGGGRGVNYGWSVMEGNQCLGGGQCDQTGLTSPTFQYGHGEGCSVIGGYVYRGSTLPDLQGTYFYGDYCQRWVHSFRYDGSAATDMTNWPELGTPTSLTSFGEDAAGELYLLESSGRVSKIVPSP
ncbi:MAG: PQQ-dependent sugar dehydrogenase [Gemmatimonadales bacterium]